MNPHLLAGIELKERTEACVVARGVKASENAAIIARKRSFFSDTSTHASGLR